MKYLAEVQIWTSALLLTGCVRPSSVPTIPTPSPASIPQVEATEDQRITSWRITPTNEAQTYSLLLTTAITPADRQIVRRDSLVTQASYSLAVTGSPDSTLFSGSITTFTVHGSTPESDQITLGVPIPFAGKLVNHNIFTQTSKNTESQNQNDCQNPDQTALQIIQRNIVTVPLLLNAHQTWTDSISSTICNGTLPTIHTAIRTFTVIGESELSGVPVLTLTKSEKTFSKGEGSLGQHRILIESQGLTTGHLYLDRSSGQILASNSTNTTSLSIQSSGRTQNFIQNSAETIDKLH